MNTQKQKNNRRPKGVSFYIILAFLAIAIIFGAVFNIIADITERRLYPREYTEFVEKYSDEFGVPEKIIYSVIKTESDFIANAVSPATPPALGLMQLTEETYEWVASKLKESPSAATRTVVRYLIGSAHPLELDNNGRAVIPPNLREFAGLEKDVVIMGVSDRVEIWDSKDWDAMEASVCTEDVTKLMIELGL